MRLRRVSRVQTENIGPRQQFGEINDLDALLTRERKIDIRIIHQHIHVKSLGTDSYSAPGLPKANNPQGFPGEQKTAHFMPRPLPAAHGCVSGGDTACQREQQAKGMLYHCGNIDIGHVQHQNATSRGGLYINILDALSSAGNDLQARRGGEKFCIDAGGRTHDNGIGFGERGQYFGAGFKRPADDDIVSGV